MTTAQALPCRQLRLETRNFQEIESRQPERHRSVVQLESGSLAFRLRELSWGAASLQNEAWSHGIRIVADRPSSYLSFACVTRGDARWMGRSIGPGSVLRIEGPWDCSSRGPFEYVAFGVPLAAFQCAADQVAGGERVPTEPGNRILTYAEPWVLTRRLIEAFDALEQSALDPSLAQPVADELLGLALRLDRAEGPVRKVRAPSPTIRLRAIRRIEDYLEAHPGSVPTIPQLCALADVSERTLEYAFRDHLGSTPVRYLRLRRLMLARRRLQNPDSTSDRVTEIAIACGFFELGRFAADYRTHFGELPSETLAESIRARSRDTRGSSPRTGIRVALSPLDGLRVGPPAGPGPASARRRGPARSSRARSATERREPPSRSS